MKKSNLRFVIREIVREEVAFAIKEIFKPNKKKINVKSLSENVNTKKLQKKKKKKVYTKNKILNEMLNDTANNDDWKNMSDGVYTTDRMNELLSNQYNKNIVEDEDREKIPVPDHIVNAINKDYSDLMKKTSDN